MYVGAIFDVWTGCYAVKKVALLVCVAINSYHSVSVYGWEHNGSPLNSHQTPLLYCGSGGMYTATVTHGSFVKKCTFEVTGS